MRKPEHLHRLSSCAGAVAILAAALAAPAQETETVSQQTAPQITSRPVAPRIDATPEQMGDTLMTHQRYQAAIEAYLKDAAPTAALWNKLGIAYQLLFNLTDATRCYRRSLQLDSKNPSVLNNMGTVFDSLKKYGNAQHMYRRSLKLEPHSALVLKNLGTSLMSQHKFKQGWEKYQAALAIDPNVFSNTARPRVENPATVQERGAMNYYMARGCVRAGMNDRAVEYLRMAMNEGYVNSKKLVADSDFEALREFPAFKELLAAQKTP